MRIEAVDRVALAFGAVRACYGSLRRLRSTGRKVTAAAYDETEHVYRPVPPELVEAFRDTGRRLEAAIAEAEEALKPLRMRIHFASTETVEDEDVSAPSWAELVVSIAKETVKPGWLECTECEEIRDLRVAVFEMLMVKPGAGPKSRSFVESELAREEARLRSGVAPIRHAQSNGLWRVGSDEVVYTEEALKLSERSRGVLEQLILAYGKPVTPETFGRKVWQDHARFQDYEYEPDTSAIKTAVSRLRKELREAGHDDIAARIPDGEKGCYRLRTS
jgi:hypothetical protein